eukprot:TRINITY_DN27806_c0_g1_i2.p1 TRINITY_DN27806_c0_g1~~TRINITY_DN27806_c0_g1_i2.p1  ORF type:complete len:663 (+),score=161.88 TRINITY_DN27806_c0_g1_i2:1384-3372(+)
MRPGSRAERAHAAAVLPVLESLAVRSCFIMLLSSSYGRAAGLQNETSDSEDAGDCDASQDADEVSADAKRLRVAEHGAGYNHSEKAMPQFPEPAKASLDPHFDVVAAAEKVCIEPHFHTEYWASRIDETLLRQWEEAEAEKYLHVPQPNAFIATDFTVLRADTNEPEPTPLFHRAPVIANFPVPKSRLVSPPRQLPSCEKSSGLKLWHLMCAERFGQPRSSVCLKMTCPYYAFDPTSVRKEVLSELYVGCLQDSLNETLYPASKARLSCSVGSASHGLTLRGGGFSQKLLKLLQKVLEGLHLEDYCKQRGRRFRAQREDLLRRYTNAWLKPQVHCAALRKLLLFPAAIRPEAKEKELAAADMSEFRDFVHGLLSSVGCEVFISGNTRQEELEAWAESVQQRLRPEAQEPVRQDVVRLKPGVATVYVEEALDTTQTNSALEVYFQLPGRSRLAWEEENARKKVLLDMLEEMMYEPFFDELRTKQQLGYSVGCSARDSDGVFGFSIYVLSAVQRPPVLLERVEAFLQDFAAQLRSHTPEKFASHAVSLAGRWLEPKRTLSELHGTCWSEIACGQPTFDRAERDVSVLGTLAQGELSSMFESYIAPGGAGRACIVTAVVPRSAAGRVPEAEALRTGLAAKGLQVNVVWNEAEFRSSSELHPARET